MATPLNILVTGGTGYIGRNLIPSLIARGHRVRVLARQDSVARVSPGAAAVIGDALDLSLIHISEPTRLALISYAVFCLKKQPEDISLSTPYL